MSNMTAEEAEARDKVADMAATISKVASNYEDSLGDLNRNSRLEWRVRTALRDLEGLLSKIDFQAMEVLERIGSDKSEKLIEELWGPFNDEV